jgi:hypothetical protein
MTAKVYDIRLLRAARALEAYSKWLLEGHPGVQPQYTIISAKDWAAVRAWAKREDERIGIGEDGQLLREWTPGGGDDDDTPRS